MSPPPRILLGRIGAPHGLRGEVVVQSFAAEPLDLKAYGPLTDELGTQHFHIKALRIAGKGLIARIKGFEDRTAVETLKGTELFIERAKLRRPKEDEFYHADLIGLAADAPNGTQIGTIVDVPNYGAGDLLEIRPVAGGETLLVIFNRQNVPLVDIAAKRVEVVLPAMVEADANEEE
jgi:16S rRNA processing protein RimM